VLVISRLAACRGAADSVVVVRVGDRPISSATVDHWASVITRKGAFGAARGEPRGTAKQRALAFLISSDWLIGEAADEGAPVPERAVDESLIDREYEGAEFQKSLHATGQTVADVKLETSAELAIDAIREKLASRVSRFVPPEREVVGFYGRHRALFHTPAARVTDLIEGQPSASVAAALARRLGSGRRFAEAAFRERIGRTPIYMSTPEKARAINTIFATRPGVIGRPVLINRGWVVFVVRQVIPARPQSFAQAHEEVVRRLEVLRMRRTAASFDRAYRARWSARTSCRPGYVVQGCLQSAQSLGSFEDPFSKDVPPRSPKS
jgi:foldase protein PrsA